MDSFFSLIWTVLKVIFAIIICQIIIGGLVWLVSFIVQLLAQWSENKNASKRSGYTVNANSRVR